MWLGRGKASTSGKQGRMAFTPTCEYLMAAFEEAAIGMQAAYGFCEHDGHHGDNDTSANRRYRLAQCFSDWLDVAPATEWTRMVVKDRSKQEGIEGLRWLRSMESA